MQAKIDDMGSSLENEAELGRLKQLRKNLQTDFDNAKKLLKSWQKTAKNIDKERATVKKLRKDIAEKERKRNDLEEGLNSTKTLDGLNEQEAKLQRKNEEDQAIINDENTSPSEREAAEERVAERNEEITRLQTQIEERERALPLRERIKEIFKKHGVTLTAILLAAGVTIGSVIGAITKTLKATGKSLGNGLKEIGKKTGSLLSGLLGSIVSFLFKAAGQAIRFLAEHTWLLIFGCHGLPHGIIHQKAALTQCQEQQPCNRSRANCKTYFVVFMCLTAGARWWPWFKLCLDSRRWLCRCLNSRPFFACCGLVNWV